MLAGAQQALAVETDAGEHQLNLLLAADAIARISLLTIANCPLAANIGEMQTCEAVSTVLFTLLEVGRLCDRQLLLTTKSRAQASSLLLIASPSLAAAFGPFVTPCALLAARWLAGPFQAATADVAEQDASLLFAAACGVLLTWCK